jgi:hypothetical protein
MKLHLNYLIISLKTKNYYLRQKKLGVLVFLKSNHLKFNQVSIEKIVNIYDTK